MRIVYVLTTLGMGGAERQAVALAERMKERGHAVALLVLLPPQAEEWPVALDAGCVMYLGMRKRPASLIAGLARARRFLRGFRPDLIHSHTYPANIMARLLRLCSPAAVISSIHSIREGGWMRMLAYRLTDFLSRRTTTVSAAGHARYLRMRVVPAHKFFVLTNGIDTAEFAPDAARRQPARTGLGVRDEFVWLAAGRIVAAKDYPNLLRAFARVKTEFPEARLWIAGEALDGYAAQVKALADELNLGANVLWLGLRRDVAALLDAADGFVQASAWEGMPLAVGEAMAMEKPVVATDVGGVRELVGAVGVLVPAGNPEALAQAMRAQMRNPSDERLALGRAARELVAFRFSIAAHADAWEALYRSTLAERR